MAAGLTPPGHRAWKPAAGDLPRIARRATVLAVALVVALAGCATRAKGPTYPPAGVTPAPAGASTDAAGVAVTAALAAAGIAVRQPDQAYRPPEGAWFAAAPRTLVEVVVPNETAPRFVVLYAFGSAADAAAAAADQATYVARGPGKVYLPNDSRFVLRVLGSVAIFFTWSPANADARTGDVESALATIGTGIAIPG